MSNRHLQVRFMTISVFHKKVPRAGTMMFFLFSPKMLLLLAKRAFSVVIKRLLKGS